MGLRLLRASSGPTARFNRPRRIWLMRTASVVLLMTVLVACGGSGSQSTPTPEPSATVPAVTPTPSGPIEVGRVVWTTALDADGAPEDAVDTFSTEAAAIYAVAPVMNAPPGTTFTANWSYNGTSLDALSTTVTVAEGQAARWVAFHLSRSSDPWPDGTYAISIAIGGEQVATAQVNLENQ